MFENIIDQAAAFQLRDDILSGRLAPSMLFFGPPASGKGSTALELARSLSCEATGAAAGTASWKCSCPACERHRYLLHSDLLMLGPRQFSAEISASYSALLREPEAAPIKILFTRCLRKLMARFSPVLMEDDPDLKKLSSLLQSMEEGLSEFDAMSTAAENSDAIQKISGILIKDALKLESEGIGDLIPIAHIRRAAYWCRLAPNGKRKTLIIENADRMRDETRNSLLKLLEEPPATVSIVLTAQRREAIMPTILSRLRPYRFLRRGAEKEAEVIRRVFRDSAGELSSPGIRSPEQTGHRSSGKGLIGAYLDSFLPNSEDKLYTLAAFFLASLARSAAVSLKKRGVTGIPQPVSALGERYAPIADAAGFARSVKISDVIKTLLAGSGNFEEGSLSRFLCLCLDMAGEVMKKLANPQSIAYSDIFKKYIGEAATSSGVLNQSPVLTMEALFYKLKTAMSGRSQGLQ